MRTPSGTEEIAHVAEETISRSPDVILRPGAWGEWLVARTPGAGRDNLGWMAFIAFPAEE